MGSILCLALLGGLISVAARPASVAARVRGAAALPAQPAPQEDGAHVRPDPRDAKSDRPRIVHDGCMVGVTAEHSSRCLYGDPRGRWTLILFGDSHAMQYFPPLQLLSIRHHWRLIVLNKRECTPARVTIGGEHGTPYRTCDVWRRRSLRRIERTGRHTTVVLSGDSAYTAYGRGGQALSGGANASALEAGYLATLRRLNRAGLGTAVIPDIPSAPWDMPSCVLSNLHHLRACAFPWTHNTYREFDLRAARRARSTTLIDLTPEVCPHSLCRAVIGNALTYRDTQHLTATFTRTLAPWIATGLRRAEVPWWPSWPKNRAAGEG